MARIDARGYYDLRPIKFTCDFTKYAEGSVLVEHGDTMVLCTASVNEGVPRFLRDSGRGWLTAEYDMLPRANRERNQRDVSRLKVSGRSAEIQRLIGRSLRSVVDFTALGERTVTIDCDVLQGDGGTRCASVTGGFIALYIASMRLLDMGVLSRMPVRDYIAAIGAGVVEVDGRERVILDMCYDEDSDAVADFNIIATGSGGISEIQGSGEKRPYTPAELAEVVSAAMPALEKLIAIQRETIGKYRL